METKDSYTYQEVEDIVKDAVYASENYKVRLSSYELALKGVWMNSDPEKSKNEVNKFVKECNKKLPKSLIDKLGIKKID